MLVYDFVVMDTPFERARPGFAALPREVVARALGDGVGESPLHTLRRQPERVRHDAVVIGFAWVSPEARGGSLAHLEGELECAPLDDGRSHLSVSGTYDTPGSLDPDPWRRAREHREVEVRIRAFLRALRAALAVTGDR
jgi:hypothetical protein